MPELITLSSVRLPTRRSAGLNRDANRGARGGPSHSSPRAIDLMRWLHQHVVSIVMLLSLLSAAVLVGA